MSIGRRWKGLVGATGLALVLALAFGSGDGHAQTTQVYLWSTPVNLGPVINSMYNEDLPNLSSDGNSLYFISNRHSNGSMTDFDIYVSHREDGAWRKPKRLQYPINTGLNERGPCLSRDGRYLFFSSNREDLPGNHGTKPDLWVSYREDTSDDFGWQEPRNLGDAINTTDPDYGAALVGDPAGKLYTLLFGRLVDGHNHIYMSRYFHGYFQPATSVTQLNDPDSNDWRPTVRSDGLELFFHSDRPESMGYDIWVSTRPDLSSVWSPPSRVGPPIDTDSDEQFPAVSADGSTLVFSSNRPGSMGSGTSDLWVSTRRPIIHYWP
jgi:Tol biopolymer transport system component